MLYILNDFLFLQCSIYIRDILFVRTVRSSLAPIAATCVRAWSAREVSRPAVVAYRGVTGQ